MKLKEQFENAPKVYNQNLEVFIDYTSIADEFAIGFAEWSVAKAMGFDSFKLNDGELKMYKIEKGL
jgi:hypothetical protein